MQRSGRRGKRVQLATNIEYTKRRTEGDVERSEDTIQHDDDALFMERAAACAPAQTRKARTLNRKEEEHIWRRQENSSFS
jgi:hypothetical protein